MHVGHARFTALLTTLVLASAAHAAPGDYQLVSGTLVWPRVLMSERLAVVQGDDGVTYFAELASPEGLPKVQVGDRVAVVGREGLQRGQLTSASVSRATSAAGRPAAGAAGDSEPSASPAATTLSPRPGPSAAIVPMVDGAEAIFGTVEVVNGDTLTIATEGRWVSVDLARIDADVKGALERGSQVRVLAHGANGRLVAHGLVIDHGVAARPQ
jgi:hypothetical protein